MSSFLGALGAAGSIRERLPGPCPRRCARVRRGRAALSLREELSRPVFPLGINKHLVSAREPHTCSELCLFPRAFIRAAGAQTTAPASQFPILLTGASDALGPVAVPRAPFQLCGVRGLALAYLEPTSFAA